MGTGLLIKIARCAEVDRARSERRHPCHLVTTAQLAELSQHVAHLPEPWSGRIEGAKILFVGSNPSIDFQEEFPTSTWDDALVRDFFENRFGGGSRSWTQGNRVLRRNGSYSSANQTWADISNRASEILGRAAVSGVDYALTETVRCKSKDAKGVPEARAECMRRHFGDTLKVTNARIVVALGEHARAAVGHACLGRVLPSEPVVHSVGGVDRVLFPIGKAGSNKPRKLPQALPHGQNDLDLVRRFL